MYRWNFKHAGIENSEEYINQSEEKIKQDCESNAKNISPELLASFGQQLTKTEDIKVELHNAVLN